MLPPADAFDAERPRVLARRHAHPGRDGDLVERRNDVVGRAAATIAGDELRDLRLLLLVQPLGREQLFRHRDVNELPRNVGSSRPRPAAKHGRRIGLGAVESAGDETVAQRQQADGRLDATGQICMAGNGAMYTWGQVSSVGSVNKGDFVAFLASIASTFTVQQLTSANAALGPRIGISQLRASQVPVQRPIMVLVAQISFTHDEVGAHHLAHAQEIPLLGFIGHETHFP